MGTITITKFGRVARWTVGQPPVPVLFVAPGVSETPRRGGNFVAAPLFGDTPEGALWHLPRHGPVRTLNSLNAQGKLTGRETDPRVGKHKFQFWFSATRDFPWLYFVTLEYVYQSESETLQMMVRINRARNCVNSEPMPVSFGFHPYFATAGRPFRIRHAPSTTHHSGNDFTRSIQLQGAAHPVILETEGHRAILQSGGDFSSFILWTDDPSKYVCVEPVAGKPGPLFLEAGYSCAGTCTIQVKPN
jgi:hypothetical protein